MRVMRLSERPNTQDPKKRCRKLRISRESREGHRPRSLYQLETGSEQVGCIAGRPVSGIKTISKCSY